MVFRKEKTGIKEDDVPIDHNIPANSEAFISNAGNIALFRTDKPLTIVIEDQGSAHFTAYADQKAMLEDNDQHLPNEGWEAEPNSGHNWGWNFRQTTLEFDAKNLQTKTELLDPNTTMAL